MKKNLRIVSAAAAALLAVAPIASVAVANPATTVQAATDYTNPNYKQTLSNKSYANHVALNTVKRDAVSDFNSSNLASVRVTNGTTPFTLNADSVSSHDVTVWNGNNEITSNKLEAGKYTVKIKVTYSVPTSVTIATGDKVLGSAVNSRKVVKYITREITVGVPEDAAGSYFTSDGSDNALANNATVQADEAHSKATTLKQLKEDIRGTVSFHKPNGSIYTAKDWNKYIFGDGNATSDQNLISQLENQGVWSNGKIASNSSQYQITIRSNNGRRVTIIFQNTDALNADAPAFQVRSDISRGVYSSVNNDVNYQTKFGAPFNNPTNIPTINVIKRDSGTFNPLDYIRALDTATTKASISYTVKSNNVDWTKPGLYSVEVTATNPAKKTTDLTIPVVVSDVNGKIMTATKDTDYYRLDNNNNMVQSNLVNGAVHVNDQVLVFGQPVTHKLNGQDVQFYRVASATSNLYVRADALKNGATSTTSNEQTTTKTVMHIATLYDKNGKATNDPVLRAYNSVSVVSTPVELKDASGKSLGKFYKLAGQDRYIKVGNIDGTSRTLRHNAYVYKSNGKARMRSRKHHVVRKSGSSITTYGKSFMIAGSQMYRVGRNQYIKVANFR